MAQEQWVLNGPQTIDLEHVRKVKVTMVSGQIDVVAHDEPTARVEVHSVSGRDLSVSYDGETLEIEHPQISWENWKEAFRRLAGPRADISLVVPRDVALRLAVVNADGLISGLHGDVSLNTVNGDFAIDGLRGDLQLNAVNGDLSVRDHTGAIAVHTIGGDITASGAVTKFSASAVGADVFLDLQGTPESLRVETVSGDVTARFDADVPAAYAINKISGRLQLDGTEVRGLRGRFESRYGELGETWADVRVSTVSGDVSMMHAVKV